MSPKSRSLAPKRGLTSGIDPEIHFQRPWGDSEAWQGSVTIPPPPVSWGGDGEGTPPILGRLWKHEPPWHHRASHSSQTGPGAAPSTEENPAGSIPHPGLEFIRGLPRQGKHGKWGKMQSRARSVGKLQGWDAATAFPGPVPGSALLRGGSSFPRAAEISVSP